MRIHLQTLGCRLNEAELERWTRDCQARGFTLAPRLTAYPEYLDDSLAGPQHWIDPALRFAVLDRSDAEALGRDDPGSQFPERVEGTTETADGASGWNLQEHLRSDGLKGKRIGVVRSLAGFHTEVDRLLDVAVVDLTAAGATTEADITAMVELVVTLAWRLVPRTA